MGFNTLEGIYLAGAIDRFMGSNGMLEGCWHLGNPGLLFHNHLFMVPTVDCSPHLAHSFGSIKLSGLFFQAL